MRRLALLLITAGAVLVAGCGGGTHPGAKSRAGQSNPVTELRSIQQLRSDFEAHDGTPRLLILASPT